jgi:hypothetical protein
MATRTRDGRRSEDPPAAIRVDGRHDFDGSALGQRPRRRAGTSPPPSDHDAVEEGTVAHRPSLHLTLSFPCLIFSHVHIPFLGLYEDGRVGLPAPG